MCQEITVPVVHPVVDQRIDHGVGHGEPVEGQVHVLDIVAGGYGVVMVRVDEVAMVRQPAESEYGHYNDEHSDNLRKKQHTICPLSSERK